MMMKSVMSRLVRDGLVGFVRSMGWINMRLLGRLLERIIEGF